MFLWPHMPNCTIFPSQKRYGSVTNDWTTLAFEVIASLFHRSEAFLASERYYAHGPVFSLIILTEGKRVAEGARAKQRQPVHSGRNSTPFELAPPARAVIGNNGLKEVQQGTLVDGFALTDLNRSCCKVALSLVNN